MRQLNYLYTNREEFVDFLHKENVELFSESILVQIFASSPKEKIVPIVQEVHTLLPHATIIGSSTAGEILENRVLEKSVVLAISVFEKTTLKSCYIDEPNSFVLGQKIAKKLIGKDTKCIITFLEGLKHNGEEFLEGINSQNSHGVIVAGGMAGDLLEFKETFIIHNDRLYTHGAVAVALISKDLEVFNDYNLGWRPVGPKFTITKAKGNRVYEIDNKPVKEFYTEVLGEDVAVNLPASAIEFPLLKEENGVLVARAMMRVFEDGSCSFAGLLREGEKVQIGIGSPTLISQYNPKDKIKNKTFQACFIYSCVARRVFLASEIEKAFTVFANIAPTSGFFTFGEFFSKHSANFLNITSTLLFLLEKGTKVVPRSCLEKDYKKSSQYHENASLHLIDYISNNLQEQRRKFEEEKFLFDEFFKAVNSVIIISKTDPQGIITYVNKKFEEISGYSKEELVGKSHNIIRDPNAEDAIFQDLWATIKQGRVWEGILSNRAKDGSIYYVKTHIFPIFDKRGKIVEYLAIREDITELVKTQKAYEKELQFSRMLLDNEENIIVVEKNGHIETINETFFRIFPYENLESFLSWHEDISDLFVEKEGYLRKSQSKWYEPILKEPFKSYVVLMVDKYGYERIFSVKSRQIEIEDDVYVIHTFNDITELELAKQKAQEAKAAQAMFLANMSHEIRTPMNGILGFTELLQTTKLNEIQKKYVDMISSSTKTLLNIINDILDFSKISNKKIELEKIELNPYVEISTTFELLRTLAEKKAIDYQCKIDPNICECLIADPTRLKQILTNLLSNAIKFTPQNGSVTLEIKVLQSSQTNQKVRFIVSDTGIGIPKEKLSTIFKPFIQADSATTRKYGGTGLGLAISYDLVKLFGGELKVESQVGEGTTFYFDVMLQKCQKSAVLKNLLAQYDIVLVEGLKSDILEQVKNILSNFNISYRVVDQEYINQSLQDNSLVFASDSDITKKVRARIPSQRIICLSDTCRGCDSKDCNVVRIGENFISDLYRTLVTKAEFAKKEIGPSFTSPLHILIAEDYEMNRALMESLLQNYPNITYDFAIDGEEAVQKALSKEYDIIFMDINMPKLSGVEATKEIRRKLDKHTPIVALTANVVEDDKKRFMEAGMNAYLAKPITIEAFNKVLTQFAHTVSAAKSRKESQKSDLNLDYLFGTIQDALGIDKDTIYNLLQKYIQSLKKSLEEFTIYIQTDEKQKIADLAHKLKGSSGTLGLDKMAQTMKIVEEAARKGKEVDFDAMKDVIKEHIDFLEKELQNCNNN